MVVADFFLGQRAGMHGGDYPVRSYKKAGRQAKDLISARDAAIVHQSLKGQAALVNKASHVLGTVVDGDGQHHKTFLLVLLVDSLYGRHLHFTGPAPGGPEIDEHGPAAPFAQADRLAVQIQQCKVGSGDAYTGRTVR